MLQKGKEERNQLEFVSIEALAPKDHLLRKIDEAVDFTKIYEMVEGLYCPDNSRPNIDPVVLFKMTLTQHIFVIPSLRKTAEKVHTNIYYRWFLGYLLNEETPHFLTLIYCHIIIPFLDVPVEHLAFLVVCFLITFILCFLYK